MINKEGINPFQTYYASREQSNSPVIPEIVRISKKLETLTLLENSTTTISLGYGKRIVINGSNADFKNIKRDDIIEVADYDPVKKIVLALGQIEPTIDTPLHYMIHYARNDVNAIVQINNNDLVNKFSDYLPSTEKEQPDGTLEQIKEVLKTLRNSKSIILKNKGILFVGLNTKEVEDLIVKTCEKGR